MLHVYLLTFAGTAISGFGSSNMLHKMLPRFLYELAVFICTKHACKYWIPSYSIFFWLKTHLWCKRWENTVNQRNGERVINFQNDVCPFSLCLSIGPNNKIPTLLWKPDKKYKKNKKMAATTKMHGKTLFNTCKYGPNNKIPTLWWKPDQKFLLRKCQQPQKCMGTLCSIHANMSQIIKYLRFDGNLIKSLC